MVNKLELTWVGKNEKINIEPRILIENPDLSYGDKDTGNILIHGDNLLSLKALENKYAGKVKCIYIDPPYNTGSAFENYDDNLEHSIWLKLMNERIKILRNLLSEDGVIFIQIDDNEQAYLTVVMDEIFGRNNRINTICVNMSNMSGVKVNSAIEGKRFPKIKEYILLYCKNKDKYKLKIPKQSKEKWDAEYNYIIPQITESDYEKMENGDYSDIEKKINELELIPLKKYMKENRITDKDDIWKKENSYRIIATKPNTALLKKCIEQEFTGDIAIVTTSQGLVKLITTKFNRDTKTARIELVFAKSNSETYFGDHWNDIVTTGGVGQEGNVEFKNSKKPEKLVSRIIECATKENDIVLDSFLGSGTTCAVANKMRRKWIGIEMGDHIYTHCIPRINNVIDGTDGTGVTSKYNWKGGGGYRFYELAPSLINIDSFGEPVINKEYNAEMLAAAVALHEGFKYNPSNEKFWKQSVGNENSYLYVTTKFVTKNDINKIKEEMNDAEYLVIACTAYDKEIDGLYKNIKIKKIPEMLLSKCEFGKDNYNLNIINSPECEEKYKEDE